MKTHKAIWILGVLTAWLVNECQADLNGTDDFNDNFIDPTRWTNFSANAGFLTETNGRLQYTTSGAPTELDLATKPWILNFGSYTQNWEVRIDVNVPTKALNANQNVGFGLLVYPGTNPFMAFTNRFTVVLGHEFTNHLFHCNVATNTVDLPEGLGSQVTTSTNGSVRVAFDASSKVLGAFYDTNGPICGYSWTLFGSTNVPADWNMTSTSVFGVQIYADSKSNVVVSSDNVFGDNLRASSGATPRLGITLGSGEVVLSWSSNAPACQLESSSILAAPICWQVVTNAPGIVSTNFAFTNAALSDKAFYRLSR